MNAFCNPHRPSSKYHRMDHDARIQAAIDDLESQSRKNIAAIARKYKVARETLSKRFRGETGSNRDATSYSRKQLTDTQEEALITYVNKLNDRGFPPTLPMYLQIHLLLSSLNKLPPWCHGLQLENV